MTTKSATAVIALSAAWTTAVLSYWYSYVKLKKIEADYDSKRQAERKGRIRAEVKLRTLQKKQKNLEVSTADKGSTGTTEAPQQHRMVLKCIGMIKSPYTKRMGTPRQGALAPSSRGCVQLLASSTVPMETLCNIDDFSHVWLIFGFHANTDLETSRKTKVKPPRGGGVKVGALATRSPHRPNPLGLSLVRVERLDAKKRQLHISALDLVHGTPVYDIKPCVPWDLPGHYDGIPQTVPAWVSQEDELSHVRFSKAADAALARAVDEKRVAWPLYSSSNDGYAAARETIEQILAQDPRADNKRGSVTRSSENTYKIVFGSIQVAFAVQASGGVLVVSVEPVQFSESAYVDGVPLASVSSALTMD